MGELDYPQDSHEWAWEKGIKRRCSKHNIDYDPQIGCKKCADEKRGRQEKKRKLKAVFDNVIWPDK